MGLGGDGAQDVGVSETVAIDGRGERERGVDCGDVRMLPHVTHGQRGDRFRNVESLEAIVVASDVDAVGTVVDETKDSLALVNGSTPHVGASLVLERCGVARRSPTNRGTTTKQQIPERMRERSAEKAFKRQSRTCDGAVARACSAFAVTHLLHCKAQLVTRHQPTPTELLEVLV